MRNVTSYLPLWTIRAMLLRRMYQEGVTRLRADNSPWQEFASTFPDQKQMLSRVVRGPSSQVRGYSCVEALQHSKYHGPPELMAMYLCFVGAMEKVSTNFFANNYRRLLQARQHYKVKHKQNPVLMELVKLSRQKKRL